MKNIPNKIFIQIGEDCPDDISFREMDGYTWCTEKINENDIEYVLPQVASVPEKASNVICPQCKKPFELKWNEYSGGPKTIFMIYNPSGVGVCEVDIKCPHCDYEEEL